MASTNKTTNYQLSQFQSSDIPAWLTDYNGDMQKIDAGIHAAKTQADGAASGVNLLQTAVSGKQDRLDFDSSPIAGSTNPVTSGGIYNALQNVGIQTDAVPTEGSTKAVQSGGVYVALQGKQNNIEFNAAGNFYDRSGRAVPDLRYLFNTANKSFIANLYGDSIRLISGAWAAPSDALFPSLQKLYYIDGNPFNLSANASYPVTQSAMINFIDYSLGCAKINSSNNEDTTCYIEMAYIADENKTYIFARANYPDTTTNQATHSSFMFGDLSYSR